MLRLAAILLLVCALAVEAQSDTRRRCRYRAAKQPVPVQVIPRPEPQPIPIHRPRICVVSGSFIGDDYWTSIGYDGQIRDGRSRADFLIFDQINNGYIAYWITRTKYGSTHYEAFGHAFVRDDGRICAWFVGLEKEIVEVCGGFRILSRSRFNPSEPIPFEWVLANPHYGPKETLGFHDHRIAKHSWEGENFYGDARLKDRNFQGVSPSSEQFVEVSEPFDFERKIWVLRRKPDAPIPERTKSYPEISTNPRDNINIKYADPHVKEDRNVPLRTADRDPYPRDPQPPRTQEFREPERSAYVPQETRQEPPRPYAPTDDRDPRYYDPRYWFDRRNWRWVNGDWKYEPGNFEYFTSDPQYVSGEEPKKVEENGVIEEFRAPPVSVIHPHWVANHPDQRDPRYYDPRFWYDRRNWKLNSDGKWEYDPENYENFTENYLLHRPHKAPSQEENETPSGKRITVEEEGDKADPRYYDPKYWYDRRNWQWNGEKWIYNPGTFEFFDPNPNYYRTE